MIRRSLPLIITFAIGVTFSSIVAFAWTGPTQTAPNGNVSAPLNVGTTDQTKNAGLGINSLAVFGNAIISTVGGYLNFGTIAGSSGYGIRDNAGTMEVKSNNGVWQAIGTSTASVGAGAAGLFGQIFTSSGTFMVPADVTAVKAILIGGGGGWQQGFGCVGGGGAGGTATKWITGLTPGAAMSVVVGAGGGAGGAGGSSSFAGVTASGGFPSNSTVGGAGGSTSGADLGVTGGNGGSAFCAFSASTPASGVSRGEYSNTLGYNFGGGGGTSGAQSGVVIIQW